MAGGTDDPRSGPPRQSHEEQPASVIPGLPVAAAVTAATALAILLLVIDGSVWPLSALILSFLPWLGYGGLLVVGPNQSRVLILFGRYVGTVTEPGWWCCNPLSKRQPVSLRVRNFQTEQLKVNDAAGSPIEIGAVVVWRVIDTAKAVFDVDDYERFVVVQSETALRHLAGRYAYDDQGQDAPSLRGHVDEVHRTLQIELQNRLRLAGIEILEARLTHLAYAPEIAAAMLRRQQADALIAARRTIVEGATGLVQMAVSELTASDCVELDPERQAAMASNLMVVLSGDRAPTPVINTASLYT